MKKMQIIAIVLVVVVVAASAGAWFFVANKKGRVSLTLATTTSTQDSGLLDFIIPDFEKKHNADVKVVAVGSGQALALGKNGDADVLLVHSPSQELDFVKQGYGSYRWKVMYNQFVIVGPASDPAGLNGTAAAKDAFKKIYTAKATFCSRGDGSGTHSAEKKFWAAAGFNYTGISGASNSSWYLSLGQGMGDTLRTASEKHAYALTDEGTWYKLVSQLGLKVLVKGDASMFNQYGVIPVNATMHPNVNSTVANDFANWITSPETQALIASYNINGHQVFVANTDRVP